MTELSNHEVVNAYLDAHKRHDFGALGRLRAPGWYQEWPQTRERVRGHDNDAAIMRNWPGGAPEPGEMHATGSEDRWLMTPAWTYQRVVGSGDFWWAEGTGRYPDGSRWFVAVVAEVHDGQVHRETWYFAPQVEAPAWRAEWVETMPSLENDHAR